MVAEDPKTLKLEFNRFWIDQGDALRADVAPGTGDGGDTAITAIGRAAFFPALALFPVLHVDAEIAVFRFPPLRSNIAVRRVG